MPRNTLVLSKVTAPEKALIDQAAAERGTTTSSLIRDAVLALVSQTAPTTRP